MKNSLRNKEDEEIIQELVSVNALKASKVRLFLFFFNKG